MDADMADEIDAGKEGPFDHDTEMDQDPDEVPPAKRIKGEPEGVG